MVIVLADVANLASTALTIAIQRDWIVVITGYNRGHLAGEEFRSLFSSRWIVFHVFHGLASLAMLDKYSNYTENRVLLRFLPLLKVL